MKQYNSEQRILKKRESSALISMVLTTFMSTSSTFLSSDGSVFAAKACLCITQ